MRDALILAPISIAVLLLIWALDQVMIGASNDLVLRWVLLYFLAWIAAWILTTLILKIPIFHYDLSHFTRCLICIALFWPLLALASSLAEVWTISHRQSTWTGPSDMGYSYMYWEMSGMGYARGFSGLSRRLGEYALGGAISGLIWFPALLLSLFVWRGILQQTEQPTTTANKRMQATGVPPVPDP